MVIHFFRNRQDQQFDSSTFYGKLIDDYFDKLRNCTIVSNDDLVQIEISLDEFEFKYSFLITRRSRVSSLYRLSPDYMNINLLIELPSHLPDFLYRTVLSQVGDVCDTFNLRIYYDGAENICEFNMFTLMTLLKNERESYYKVNHVEHVYSVDRKVLTEMFEYLLLTKSIGNYFTTPVKALSYQPMFDKTLNQVKNAVVWKAGSSAIFPPHVDYVLIEELEGTLAVIPMATFEKHAKRFLSDLKDSELPIRYLTDKYAQKALKVVQKMRKSMVPYANFDMIKLTDLVEGE